MTFVYRTCGVILVLLVAVPIYRVVYGREIGVIGADILAFTEQDRALMMIGAPISLVLGVILARAIGWEWIDGAARRVGRLMAGIPINRFAVAVGVLAACYAAIFSLWVLDGKPNLIDAMTQLLHARFVAAGSLAGPADRWNEFWQVQNSLITPHGWVSQYPPGHVMLLALGFRAGAVWAVGPFLCGLAVFFTSLAADRLLPDDRAVARLGALLAAVSSFFIAHAGAYMNHVSAAAMGAAAVYFGVRARDEESLKWPLLAGTATGATFTVRPLAAIVVAATVAVVFASASPRGQPSLRRWIRASSLASIGGLPLAALVGAYNARFFGSPFRFGYVAAQGPAMGFGFHRDPWGNWYGPIEALGFTSADLTALGLHLLGTPIPVVLVAGLFLLTTRRMTTGTRLVALWALLPVAANALYWHHGMFMGPRMLNEAAPAWALFAAVSGVGIVRRLPPSWETRGYSARAAAATTLAIAAFAGVFYLGPDRLRQYGGWIPSTRIEIPETPRPAIVFVHGGWTGRIGARLAARGMRLDSLETALRRNATCDVHHFAERYPSPPGATPPDRPVDFTLAAGELPRTQISRGNYIRLNVGDRLPPDCLREVASDTLGVVDIAPLVWQGDLPGEPTAGRMIVRDMGPAANDALIAAHPDRVPLMFMRRSDDGAPVLLPYGAGVSILWPQSSSEVF
jgi:hypothetical protein